MYTYFNSKVSIKLPRLMLILLFFSTACSSTKVTYEYDRSTNFTNYKTFSFYGWAKASDTMLTEIDKERIEKAFGREFTIRRYRHQKSGGDLMVSLYLVIDHHNATTSYSNHYRNEGYSLPSWSWGMGYSTTRYHDYDYSEGTLICDVFDATTKRLLWQGVASGQINQKNKIKEQNIIHAVEAIMNNYPIPANKK